MTADASKRRRSTRGAAALTELAERIVKGDSVLLITGAGLSVASGVRPFRSQTATRTTATPTKNGVVPCAGLWNDVIWSTATREAFRKDPLAWYNEFWLPHFNEEYQPNVGHECIQKIQADFPNVEQITQNIDGLQPPSSQMIEAHGRVGLYKCVPDDSDTDSDSDDEEDRQVHLGHRRKTRNLTERLKNPMTCPYQYLQSLPASQVESDEVREVLMSRPEPSQRLPDVPRCPVCDSNLLPQALLFDEGYHSHSYYQFERAEEWMEDCDALVLIGTSCSVRLTTVALDHARAHGIPVYNFNLHDPIESTSRLNVSNILGPAIETLPKLWEACEEARRARKARRTPV